MYWNKGESMFKVQSDVQYDSLHVHVKNCMLCLEIGKFDSWMPWQSVPKQNVSFLPGISAIHVEHLNLGRQILTHSSSELVSARSSYFCGRLWEASL